MRARENGLKVFSSPVRLTPVAEPQETPHCLHKKCSFFAYMCSRFLFNSLLFANREAPY